jgi:hypothetical protein
VKAWEIVAYVDFDACEILCDQCGVDGRHHPIFATNAEDQIDSGEVCARCHAVWCHERFEWRWEQDVFDAMKEAIDDRG